MADLTRTIEILFEGTNKTGTAITAVGRDLDELNYRVGAAAAPMADLTAGVMKLDAALAALAVAGLAYAFKKSSEFQSSFIELKKVVGDNAEALDSARVNAIELSDAYGESASSILETTANYVQAGYSVKEAMTLTKDGMDLVIAGGVEASRSSEILIATLKGFREPATEAHRLLDILNEVSNNYATDIEELGTGMAALSPVARSMGFSMEETAGILTPVIEIFRSGDEAAVALKTGLLKLVDDAAPVQNALASIGVSQRDANGELRSGKDILNDVATAFVDLEQNQKLFVTQQLVGIHQSARMVEVFDNLSKSTAITETGLKAAGSAAAEVTARLEAPEVALNRLTTGFVNLAVASGDKFQASATGTVNALTDIFNALRVSVNEGAFDDLFDALNSFGDDMAETIRQVAENLPQALQGVDFSGFIDSLGGLREAVSEIFDGIDFSKPEDITSAIQKVIDTFESLVSFSEGVAAVFVKVAKKVFDLIDEFNNLDDGTKKTFGTISGIGSVVSGMTGVLGGVTAALSSFGTAMNVVAVGQVSSLVKSLVGTGGLTAALAVVKAHPLIAAGVAGVAMGTAWRKLVPEVDAAAQSVLGFIDKHTGLLGVEAQQSKNEKQWIEIQAKWKAIKEARAKAGKDAKAEWEDATKQIKSAGEVADHVSKEFAKFGIDIEKERKINIDTAEAFEKLETLEYYRESTKTWETIKVPVDASQLEKVKEAIDEIPAEKRFELETDLRIEEIKAQSATLQTAFEWNAKLEIANVEAQTERVKAIAENITEMFKSTGEVIGGLFDAWDSDASLQEKWAIQDSLSKEQERRDKALEMQEKLTEAEIKNIEARTKRLESGDALIKVEGDGLAPHLEMIMWEVFSAIQIRAKEEGLGSILLGPVDDE